MTVFIGTYTLPGPIGLTSSCFGKRFRVRIGDQPLVMVLPQVSPGDPPELVGPDIEHLPIQRGPGISSTADDRRWGVISSWNSSTGQPIGGAWLGKIALKATFPEPIAYSDYLHGLGSPDSDEIKNLFNSVDEWFERLTTWIGVVVDQDTHHREPLGSISVPGQGLTIRAVLSDGRVSLPRSSNEATIFTRHNELVNLTTLRAIVKRTNAADLPTDAWLLLRDGYIDLRRGRLRKAVIDAGSAAESAMAMWSRANQVHLPAKPTLGWFVSNAGAPIPATTNQNLVVPRNDAIHNNISPSQSQAWQAVALAKQILETLHPL